MRQGDRRRVSTGKEGPLPQGRQVHLPAATPPLSRRSLLKSTGTVAAAAMAGAILDACGSSSTHNSSSASGGASGGSSTGSVHLTVWEQEPSIPPVKPVAAAFTKKHPNISVSFTPIQETATATKLLAALSAHSGLPDLAFISYTEMGKFTSIGGAGLLDWKPIMSKPPYSLSQWWKPALDIATTSDGKIVGLPADYGSTGTYYRKDALAAAKLPTDPDGVSEQIKTWSDFMAFGKKLRSAGKFALFSAADVFNIARQQGVQAYFDGGKTIVNNAEFVHAAELAQQIRKDGLDVNPPNLLNYLENSFSDPAAGRALADGAVAFWFSAAYFEIFLAGLAPKTKGKWGATLLPDNARANIGGSYYVLPTAGSHAAEAQQFASYALASKAGMQLYLSGFAFLPTWKPAYTVPAFAQTSPFFGDQKILPTFVKLAAQNPKLVVTGNDSIAVSAVNQALVDILSKGADPQKRLDQAASQIDNQAQ